MMLISLTVVIVSLCICISTHPAVHLTSKPTQLLFLKDGKNLIGSTVKYSLILEYNSSAS